MTPAERTLLKVLAGWVVEQENKIADDLGHNFESVRRNLSSPEGHWRAAASIISARRPSSRPASNSP
jgi:hypothetical protein